MKILTIPDVHGRDNWKRFVADDPNSDLIIFLGDYLDSFHQTNEQIESNLLDIIQFKKNNLDKIILLWGNHELPYLLDSPSAMGMNHGCSGFRPETHYRIHDILNENKKLFQASYQYEDYIWTHAGIHRGWYQMRFIPEFNKHFPEFEGNIADKFNEAFDFELSSLFDVGYVRWGSRPVGGIFWADKSEVGLKPLKGFHQIVGHTQIDNIVVTEYPKHKSSVTFIDCIIKPYLINL